MAEHELQAEIDRLRAALVDVADPATALQRDNPDMPWSEVLMKCNDPGYIKSIASKALVHG